MNSGKRIKLKVCGMRDGANILDVASHQPDYMGFIFHPPSPRYVGDNFCLPEELQPSIQRVGVFVNASSGDMLRHAQQLRLDYLQLHGHETVEQMKGLRQEGVKIIKVFSIDEAFDFKTLEPYRPFADFFLFDTKGAYYGGNARLFNWELLHQYDQEVPFFLSGGLSPENIAAIRSLAGMNLHAVDVNSGIEIMPGVKNINHMRELQRTLNSIY